MSMWGATVLIEETPEIEFRGGLFYVIDSVGDRQIVRAMRPNVFFRLFAKAGEAAKKHKFGSAEVIPFPETGESPQAHG